MMAEQHNAFAPPPPEGYTLVSDAIPLDHLPHDDFYYWAALAHHDSCPVGLLIYSPGKLIDFLVPDEAVLLHINLARWLSLLLPYTSPAVACQVEDSCTCSDEEAQI